MPIGQVSTSASSYAPQGYQIGKRDGKKTINNKGIRVDDVRAAVKGEK
jgi:hypothetical protein